MNINKIEKSDKDPYINIQVSKQELKILLDLMALNHRLKPNKAWEMVCYGWNVEKDTVIEEMYFKLIDYIKD